MGWFSDKKDKTIGTPEARRNLKGKRATLERVSNEEVAKNGGQPIREETQAYQQANRDVIDAEQKLPFWGRW